VSLDLDAARATFEAAQDGTVGIEEEFAILDPQTLALDSRFEELREAAAGDPVLSASLAGELIAAEIEIRSGRGDDFEDALARQDDARRRLFALVRDHDAKLGSTGTHAFSDYREQRIIDTEHYRRRRDGLQYVARRNNCCALHVHVGVNGPDRAIHACDRLRTVLPTLLAISASSPFLDARDSGLHSARTVSFTKTFPRCGIPDHFGSWDAWARYIDLLARTNSIVEFTQVWWSVRPHHEFGTVELRIADAQITRAESDGLARLMVGCIERAVQEEPVAEVPHRLIEENLWRALRYGMDGDLLDLESGLDAVAEIPAREALERLQEWAGVDAQLPELNGAQRQRRMIDAGAGPYEVYAECVRETHTTYDEEAIR
jgi:glutamate---cysteine ligase / carboxylate-amine ligase